MHDGWFARSPDALCEDTEDCPAIVLCIIEDGCLDGAIDEVTPCASECSASMNVTGIDHPVVPSLVALVGCAFEVCNETCGR